MSWNRFLWLGEEGGLGWFHLLGGRLVVVGVIDSHVELAVRNGPDPDGLSLLQVLVPEFEMCLVLLQANFVFQGHPGLVFDGGVKLEQLDLLLGLTVALAG